MHSIEQVAAALESSRSAYTAYDANDWSPNNTARGQCVVSSLIVQDILGGQLQKMKVTYNGIDESHYRNILPNGMIIDTTKSQYPNNQIMETADINLGEFNTLREKLFSQANTEKRYKLLRASVLQKLT